MTQKQAIQLFEERKVRTVWDDASETWYFSVIDVVGILTDSPDPKRYWSVLKSRIKKEGGGELEKTVKVTPKKRRKMTPKS